MIVRSRLAFAALHEQFVNKLFCEMPSFLIWPCLALKEIILRHANTSAGLPFTCYGILVTQLWKTNNQSTCLFEEKINPPQQNHEAFTYFI